MAGEMIPDLRELTIEETDELLLEEEEKEVHMVDVEELLGDDQPAEKEQTPQVSPPAERILEPSPTDTTMEVDFETDPNGDKSPVRLGIEIGNIVGEIIQDIVGNGDKSPANFETDV